MAHGAHETEVKLAVRDARAARELLRAAGFRVSKRRVLEKNTVFDTVDSALRSAQELLRVREAAGSRILTYKGPPAVSKYKSREELEVEISDAEVMGRLLERLGFHAVFRYEKFRTEYRRTGRITALDRSNGAGARISRR
jgi:adenylate cyclase class 2